MCGIWGTIGRSATVAECERCEQALRNRGPEGSQHISFPTATLGFTRLAINGLNAAGMQPMRHANISWVCNGEIYNWQELALRHSIPTDIEASDCSILGPLWLKFRDTPDLFFRALDGVFSIAIYDEDTGRTTLGRDPFGVRPLFYKQGVVCIEFASEMKALDCSGSSIQPLKPGSYLQFHTQTGNLVRKSVYHTVPWIKNPTLTLESAQVALHDALVAAVRKRLMTERPIAALLSGGVDSSLIAALVQRELKVLGKPPLETYTVGFEGSPDILFAREVATHIGSHHTEIIVTPAEFFEVLPQVIRDIESYDITTVRASVGNWFVSREIRRLSQAKVLFNGDGADEVFGSYLYFFRSPDDESYEHEVDRLLKNIHRYDVLRSDRSISSHGLEPRTPFLDKQFVALARSIPTKWLRPVKGDRIEKQILRDAFDKSPLLPASVLYRQKEAFSDGVSGHANSWFSYIQTRIGNYVVNRVYDHLKPETAEAAYYRDVFHTHYGYGGQHIIHAFWMPKWSGETRDPSARTLSIY